jgi:Tfp pilus assembly protein FimT
MQQQQNRVAQERLINTLNFARTYAINHHSMVTICPSINHQDCTTDWQQALLVFTTLPAAKNLLQVTPAPKKGQLIAKIFPTTKYFRFNPQGFPDNQNGTFSYCYAKRGWNIIINRFGRIRVETLENCT